MKEEDDEEQQLREVTLRSARSIFLTRQRAEDELYRTRETLEQKTRELDHSLAMLRATLEATTDAILVTDDDGRVTDYNHHYVEMWQMPDAVLETRQHRYLLQVCARLFADPEHFVATVERIYASSPPKSFDLLQLTDGRMIERYSHIQSIEGHNVGRVWSFRDVSEQRRDEERLRQSEAQFRQLADALPQIVWTARPDGYIDYYNERWYEYTGFPRDEYGDQSWMPILHPGDVRRCVETYYGCINSGSLYQTEYRFRDRRTGGYRWFLGRAFPVRDDQGHIVRWFGTFTDIDDTKRAEESTRFLADASAALAELTSYEITLQKVASLAVPFFADWSAVDMREPDGSLRRLAVTHTDPARVELAHELFRRYPPHPDDPRGVMKVLRTGAPEWVESISDELLAGLSQDEEHLRIMRELGLKSYICVPLRSRTGTLGMLTFVTAESGRIYDEDDLRAAEDLAHRAVIAIENANLLAALRESDRRKDEFLAILAHELRNPLAPVRNALEILRSRGPLEPDLQWAREVIDRQINHMTRLVDDLLDVSRITRGRVELRKRPVDLQAVVNDAVEASRPLIEQAGHTLSVSMPAEPVRLEADPTRLSQVLLNLLNNAARYTERGGSITLAARCEDDQVVITVRDTGVGIPADKLPIIFEMFTQVDTSIERSQGGLGIGLTLVKRLIEMHDGSIEARSQGPGQGSEFIVRLPADCVPDDAQPEVAAAADKPERDESGQRILIVDDNQDSAESMAVLLRIMGHEVMTVADGLAAISEAESFGPDVILLDIGLPRLNGYEVARMIREKHGDSIVLIAMTGWGQDDDRRRSKEAGFDHHLTKPIDFEDLGRLL